MDGMVQAARRGAGLTRQLLAFSRRQPLRPDPVGIAVQMDGMRELLYRSLRGDVHVEFVFPESLWPVEVDPGELELAILFLAVNARDAMPSGGTIVVQCENVSDAKVDRLEGDYVRLFGMSPRGSVARIRALHYNEGCRKGIRMGLATSPWVCNAIRRNSAHQFDSWRRN